MGSVLGVLTDNEVYVVKDGGLMLGSIITELQTLQVIAEISLIINHSFHVLMNKFENLPVYGNFVPIMLNVILNISLIVVQNLPDCKMQMLAALPCLSNHDNRNGQSSNGI